MHGELLLDTDAVAKLRAVAIYIITINAYANVTTAVSLYCYKHM